MPPQRSPRTPRRPMTPELAVAPYQHDTPEKTRLVTAIQFAQYLNERYPDRPAISKREAIAFAGFSERTAYRTLAAASEGHGLRRHHNDPEATERRGRPRKLTQAQLDEAIDVVELEGIAARAMSWEELVGVVSAEVCGRTMRDSMQRLGYFKRIAVSKHWLPPDVRKRRVAYASTMLQRYPTVEDWKKVRFSDECHFGYGNSRRKHIIRRAGNEERYRPCNIEERNEPTEKEAKKFHVWAAVGWNFKSDLTFYEVPTNTNGKMTLQVYRDVILEGVVKPWLQRGDEFVLEEDQDGGHGTGKTNIVRTWKERNRLNCYFNASSSPDLVIIENCWQVPKQHLKERPHWLDEETVKMIREGWANLQQSYINQLVESIPKRLHDVIISEGKLTGH